MNVLRPKPTVRVVSLTHSVCRTCVKAFHHDGRQIGRCISRSQEQRKSRVDHEIHEAGEDSSKCASGHRWVHALIREEPHLERDFDGDHRPEDFSPPHDLHAPLKALDLLLVLRNQICGEEIRPELNIKLISEVRLGIGNVITCSPLPKDTWRSTLWASRQGNVPAIFRIRHTAELECLRISRTSGKCDCTSVEGSANSEDMK